MASSLPTDPKDDHQPTKDAKPGHNDFSFCRGQNSDDARSSLLLSNLRGAVQALGQLGKIDEAGTFMVALANDSQVEERGRSVAYRNLKQLVGGAAE